MGYFFKTPIFKSLNVFYFFSEWKFPLVAIAKPTESVAVLDPPLFELFRQIWVHAYVFLVLLEAVEERRREHLVDFVGGSDHQQLEVVVDLHVDSSGSHPDVSLHTATEFSLEFVQDVLQ